MIVSMSQNFVPVVGSLRTVRRAFALPVPHRCLIRPRPVRSMYRSRFRYLIQHPSRIECLCLRRRWQARPLMSFMMQYLSPHKYRNHPRFSRLRWVQRLYWIVCRYLVRNVRRQYLENYSQNLFRTKYRRTDPIPQGTF